MFYNKDNLREVIYKSFCILEISNPSELHIQHHQIHILQEGKEIKVPLEDLLHIFCIGPDIRISTKALSILSQNKISLVTLDESIYLPQLYYQ